VAVACTAFKLWVNLPRIDKLMRPRYQEIPTAKIPRAASDDGKIQVRVIAGEALAAKAVIDTRTPINLLHYTVAPGASVIQQMPTDHNVFAYVFDGSGEFGSAAIAAHERQMVVSENDGDQICFASVDERTPMQLLLIGGLPLREPVARYGPFVMNTKEEIATAISDYQSGRFGKIAPIR
jgi:redox-sensitive bicupin YhaK (pirin superfamily)